MITTSHLVAASALRAVVRRTIGDAERLRMPPDGTRTADGGGGASDEGGRRLHPAGARDADRELHRRDGTHRGVEAVDATSGVLATPPSPPAAACPRPEEDDR